MNQDNASRVKNNCFKRNIHNELWILAVNNYKNLVINQIIKQSKLSARRVSAAALVGHPLGHFPQIIRLLSAQFIFLNENIKTQGRILALSSSERKWNKGKDFEDFAEILETFSLPELNSKKLHYPLALSSKCRDYCWLFKQGII